MAGVNKSKSYPNTGSAGKLSTGLFGLYHRKPVPIKFLRPSGQNGPVKIIKPAKEKS